MSKSIDLSFLSQKKKFPLANSQGKPGFAKPAQKPQAFQAPKFKVSFISKKSP